MSLALSMRPKTLSDILGQNDVVGPDSVLNRMIQKDELSSIILYGPPGTGKTTIASIIADTTHSEFKQINAVADKKADMEKVCKQAQKDKANGTRTIMFIDEIHRFNKAQQDYLLPFVESGDIILIGATTENPFFEINKALISRCAIFTLHALTVDDIESLIRKALTDTENGLGNRNLSLADEDIKFIAVQSNGDARHALTILEMAANLTKDGEQIESKIIRGVIQQPSLDYDKDGNGHYDTISAFIKSMRGSDPDATLYYLAKMILSGEDPKYIARRIIVHASEDVGMADPNALNVAISAALAAERVGLPECRINLAEAALYVATAPKSNSVVTGIDDAIDYITNHPTNDIPPHLRDNHYKSAYKLGAGIGYLYPHNFPGHFVAQQYLPDGVNEKFYTPSDNGKEAQIKELLEAQDYIKKNFPPPTKS